MPPLDSRLIWGCWLAVLGLCACGGVSRVEGSGSAGSNGAGRGGDEVAGNASGGGAAGASAGGASAGGANAGGANAGGANAGGANACSTFRDEDPQLVVVTIRNDMLAPLYIGSRIQTCGATPLYEVRDASKSPVSERGPCSSPCQGWLDGAPIGGCLDICQISEVTKVAPGETIVTQWAGLNALDVKLPLECSASPLAGEAIDCVVDKRIAPGSYTFSSSAGAQLICDDDLNGCGECTPAAGGGCIIHGATVAGTVSSAVRTVDLDASYGIGGSSGASNGSGQNRQVELAFPPLR